MKPDHNQVGIPGMLISLPTNRLPATVETTATTTAPNKTAEETVTNTALNKTAEKVSSARPDRSTRGTRLPEHWLPPQEVINQMQTECPNVNQEIEYRKFCDYWHDQPGAKGRKVNWVGTYRNWIRKAAGDYPRTRRSGLSAVDEKALGWQGAGR
jgi:hypothetical protein